MSKREQLRWLDTLPFPVAYPLWYTHASKLDTYSQLWNAVFAAQQAMRVTGLLLLADYLDCEARSRRVNEAVACLRLPHWADWTRVCTTLAAFWRGEHPQERPERASSFPWLVSAWRAVNGVEAPSDETLRPLLDGLPGNEGPARHLNDAMSRRRNLFGHGTGTRTPGGGPRPEEVKRYADVAAAMTRALFGRLPFTIVRRVTQGRMIRLHGPHPDLRFAAEPSPPDLEEALARTGVAVVRDQGPPLPLFPLFVPEGGDGYDESGGLIEPVTFIDEIRRQHVVLFGVMTRRVDTETARTLHEALARKEASLGLAAEDVTPWSIAAWARASTRETLAELETLGISRSMHVVRSGVDDQAEAYDAPGRALLLVGDAGTGRTSLLARLARSLVGAAEGQGAAPNDVVAMLDAKSIEGAPNAPAGELQLAVCNALFEGLGIRPKAYKSISDLLAALDRSTRKDTVAGRRTWIFIDDLDEHPRFLELAALVRGLVLETRRYPWLRIVVTLRAGAQRLLFDRETSTGVALFALDGVWMESEGRPYVWLRALSSAEIGRAADLWATRQAQPVPALEGLAGAVRDLIANPWYLRIFLESIKATDKAPLTEDELLDRHLDAVTQQHPGARATMTAIATRFLRSGSCALPLDEAEALTDRWRAEELGGEHDARLALDPIELLVTRGVLLKPTTYGVIEGRRAAGYVFAHPQLCCRALVRALEAPLGDRKAPTPDEIDAILKLVNTDGHPIAPEIKEAIAKVGGRMGRETGDDVLERLASRGDQPLADVLLANALVTRALRDAPPFDGLVALAGRLSAVVGDGAGKRRGWARALSLAASIAALASVPVTELFAKILESTASPEDIGDTATTLRKILEDLEKIDAAGRAAARGAPFIDPRQFPETDGSSGPPSKPLPKGQGDVRRLRNATDIHFKGERAHSKGDRAEARRLYETALAEYAVLSKATPDSMDAWARTTGKLANLEGEEGRPLVARELLLACLAELRKASMTTKSPLATPIIRSYVQLRSHTKHRGLRALYIGRVRALLRSAPREGLDGTFTNLIDALTRDKERRDPPALATVRCPRCSSPPIEDARWLCTCGYGWNTFRTGGVCPRCELVHATTTCLACNKASPHGEWYEPHPQRQP